MVGVAVNVTVSSEQIVVADATMLTVGATVDPTVMVIALDVAADGFAQASDEVITQVTTSPFTNAVFW